jgi:hypothetical protein
LLVPFQKLAAFPNFCAFSGKEASLAPRQRREFFDEKLFKPVFWR